MYQTVEQVRGQLSEMAHGLDLKVQINHYILNGKHLGVEMRYKGTSIISRHGTAGAEEGLFEVLPLVDGMSPRELFGPKAPDVVGSVTLADAIRLAEAARQDKESLRMALRQVGYPL